MTKQQNRRFVRVQEMSLPPATRKGVPSQRGNQSLRSAGQNYSGHAAPKKPSPSNSPALRGARMLWKFGELAKSSPILVEVLRRIHIIYAIDDEDCELYRRQRDAKEFFSDSFSSSAT